MRKKKVFLFIGPTSYGISLSEVITPDTVVLPPVRRGDIQRLIEQENTGTIVIVDGTYHAYPAVSHVEIKNALKVGWDVWGMSSMGAIRAAEMYALGMQGYGAVFQHFCDDENLPDDYVALIHGTEYPWFPISEPLIHIEFILQSAVHESIISQEVNELLMDDLKSIWFGYRTLKYLKDKTKIILNGNNEAIIKKLDDIGKYRLKSKDVINFFLEKPYL